MHFYVQEKTVSIFPENFMKIDGIVFKLHKNMWEYLTEYCKDVAIETTLIDIHSDNILVSVGEDNIYFPWKFHEDWLNNFQVT